MPPLCAKIIAGVGYPGMAVISPFKPQAIAVFVILLYLDFVAETGVNGVAFKWATRAKFRRRGFGRLRCGSGLERTIVVSGAIWRELWITSKYENGTDTRKHRSKAKRTFNDGSKVSMNIVTAIYTIPSSKIPTINLIRSIKIFWKIPYQYWEAWRWVVNVVTWTALAWS